MAKLKSLREQQVLSLQELADKAGVSKNTVWNIEHGKNRAYPRTIRKLATALGVEPQELVKAS